jgi:transposase
MVFEHQEEHDSQWAAICSIANKFGISHETLRKWVRRAEVDHGLRPGLITEEREHLKTLELENRELRRANEILKSASAFFAAELTSISRSSNHESSPHPHRSHSSSHQRSEEAVEETPLHEAGKQPDAEPSQARDDDEDGGSDPGGVHDARTLRRSAMRMRSELMLSGHPGPTTESE